MSDLENVKTELKKLTDSVWVGSLDETQLLEGLIQVLKSLGIEWNPPKKGIK